MRANLRRMMAERIRAAGTGSSPQSRVRDSVPCAAAADVSAHGPPQSWRQTVSTAATAGSCTRRADKQSRHRDRRRWSANGGDARQRITLRYGDQNFFTMHGCSETVSPD